MTGRVAAFDDDVGTGTVTAADGTTYFFHCTRIAGGSRTIAVGTAVDFEVAPGHGGRWEATAIRPTANQAGREAGQGSGQPPRP